MLLPTPGASQASQPSWSPDGTRLVFTCEVEPGNIDLCLIKVDGTGLQRLTTAAGADLDPDWGPHGSIALTTHRYTGREEIAVIEPVTGAVTRVATGKMPSWSGNGSRLAFVVDGLGIMTAQADGSNWSMVNHQGGYAPSWRP